jgi:hypothetical protein
MCECDEKPWKQNPFEFGLGVLAGLLTLAIIIVLSTR